MNFRTFLENDLESLNFNKVIQDALNDTDWSSDEWSYMAKIELGWEDDDVDEEELDKKARELAEEEYGDRFYDTLYTLEQLGPSFEVFRVITVMGENYEDLEKAIQTNKIGPYWSWDDNAAEAHWGNFNAGYKKITLGANVQTNQVDWHRTMLANIKMSEEKEIHLKQGRVKINGIKFANQWYQVNLGATV